MENSNNVDDTKNDDQSNNQEVTNLNKIIETLVDLLKVVNLTEIVDSLNNVKLEKIKSEEKQTLENLNSKNLISNINFNFWKLKFFKEFCVILILLLAISFLSYIEKIDNCTLGTLLGSIIGYSIGNFSSSNKRD